MENEKTAETIVEKDAELDTNNAEFTDTSNATPDNTDDKAADSDTVKSDKEPEKVQSKADNAEFARRRREQEKAQAIKQAEEKAIIRALKGVNPYTNEPIKDSSDVEEYKTMLEIEEAGGDPVADYAKHIKDKTRQAHIKQSEEQKKSEWFIKDKEDFATKYPDVTIDELAKDKGFMKFAKGKIGNIAMAEIYSDYNDLVADLQAEKEKEAKAKVKQIIANKNASPGSVASNTTTNDFFSRDQVKAMSQEEVNKNYEKIRESMKKWK